MANKIVFALNGEKVELNVENVDPTTTLNDYIRSTRFTGTKLSCGEGGCGACAVDVARLDQNGNEQHISVNSCLRLLTSVDGWSVTTTDGLGNCGNFHAVQERIANYNASQCGFCTPGMVMTMYSSLKANPNITMKETEERFDGNLCRCTGYRPILDACKSFASDSNIVDHVSKRECKNYDPSQDPKFPEFLKNYTPQAFQAKGSGKTLIRPTSLEGVFKALEENKDSRIVVANTSVGIYKNQNESTLIDVQYVKDLCNISINDSGVTVGAAVSITNFVDTLRRAQKERKPEEVASFEALALHALRIANVHVRNAGSVGGNLMLAKSKGFLSDLATILLGANTSVHVATKSGNKTVSMEEFLESPALNAGEILHSFTLPFSNSRTVFRTYKAALRPVNSHAFVNAAFNAEIDSNVIKSATLSFGGVMPDDAPGSHAVNATKLQDFLEDKPIDADLCSKALKLLGDELSPATDYRKNLCLGFLYKFFVDICPTAASNIKSAATNLLASRKLNCGFQSFVVDGQYDPVGKPLPKQTAALQAAGRVQYVDDLPERARTVYATLVTSTIACGKISKIDTTDALASPGCLTFIGAEAITGENNYSVLGDNDELFATERICYNGQPIGLIVADSIRHAEAAAKLVKVTYEEETPVITIKQAMAAGDKCKTPIINHHENGDVAKALEESEQRITGEVYMGSQKHFYMEPLGAYAIPDEDGSINIYCPNQWPDVVQGCICKVVGKPKNRVRLIHRRSGGAFGGKLLHSVICGAAACVASIKLDRPVKIALNRNIDMRIAGGREETLCQYEVGFTKEGKITALKMEGSLNGGFNVGLSAFCNMAYASAFNEAYDSKVYNYTSKLYKSNLPGRTAVRGPGEIQASYSIETILEHVAHATGKPPHEIRELNFYAETDEKQTSPNGTELLCYTIPQLYKQIKQKVNFEQRLEACDKFNKENKWKKRGVAITPVRYQVNIFPRKALVNLYGDGSVVVAHGGSDIGQGINIKIAQAVTYELNKLFDGVENVGEKVCVSRVRFNDLDTFIIPNSTFTGGSTTSESSAIAAQRACKTLIDRLKPTLEALQKKRAEAKTDEEKNKPITWTEIVATAGGASVNLQAQDVWQGSGDDSLAYHNYGTAFSEVELDVITGELEVRESHLIYDCGQSLNPAIDLGQAEGAYVMGLGHLFRETVTIDENNGNLDADGTWEYKIPCYRDIPEKFTVEFMHNPNFNRGVLSSKSSGEPPLVLATSAAMAARQAIASAREDAGLSEFFVIPTPITPQEFQKACAVDPSKFEV